MEIAPHKVCLQMTDALSNALCDDGNKKRSTLACQALSIALQHWMIPNFGWHPSYLDEQMIDLRRRLTTSTGNSDSKDAPGNDSVLDNECIQRLKQEVKDLRFNTTESLLPSHFDIQVYISFFHKERFRYKVIPLFQYVNH